MPIFRKCGLFVLIGGLTACAVDPVPYDRPQPQTEAEIAFMKTALDDIQKRSFSENREYCGYLMLEPDGRFSLSGMKKGRKSSCVPKDPKSSGEVVASFHTHGAYSSDHDSEYPSPDDIFADIEEGNDGYVATPGGRLWYIDGAIGTAKLLCGADCVISDAAYQPDENPPKIGRIYTLGDLEALAEE